VNTAIWARDCGYEADRLVIPSILSILSRLGDGSVTCTKHEYARTFLNPSLAIRRASNEARVCEDILLIPLEKKGSPCAAASPLGHTAEGFLSSDKGGIDSLYS
jgi:hypothetical protein